jgi:hypothetical protein
MTIPRIPDPHNPGSLFTRLPRSNVVGPTFEDDLSEAEVKSGRASVGRSANFTRLQEHHVHSVVRVEEFDCE